MLNYIILYFQVEPGIFSIQNDKNLSVDYNETHHLKLGIQPSPETSCRPVQVYLRHCAVPIIILAEGNESTVVTDL
jgi:hypothetical protein